MVVEVNVSEENQIDDSAYFINPTDYYNFLGKKIYRLKLIGTNTINEQLNLERLRDFRLRGKIQGPRTISGNLLEYIDSVFYS